MVSARRCSRSLGVALSLILADALEGQGKGPTSREQDPQTARCIASLPDSAFSLAPVFAVASLPDLQEALAPYVGNIVQDLAARFSTTFTGSPGNLPTGEPNVTWRDLGGELELNWYRDGHLAWRVVEGRGSGRIGVDRLGAVRLLAQVLQAADSAHDAFYPWPQNTRLDSLQFRLWFVQTSFAQDGTALPPPSGGVPVFAVSAPYQVKVKQLSGPQPVYPERAVRDNIGGEVGVTFEIDSAGLPILDTFTPLETPTPSALSPYLAEFLQSVREAVSKSRYQVPSIGGCSVRQVILQRYSFGQSARNPKRP